MLPPYRIIGNDVRVASPPPLPSRLLRRVLGDGKHIVGEHVLIAGSHSGEIAEWMDGLGFDVEAIDDSQERVLARQRCGTRVDIQFARLDGSVELGEMPFDLILADRLNLHQDNLLGLSARLATAELLAHLKPGGELVIVQEPDHPGHHSVACWTRHLACFPGRLETYEYPTPFLRRQLSRWVAGLTRPDPFLTVSLKIPQERLTLLEWCEHANRGLLTSASCCSQENVCKLPRAA